MIKLKSSTEKEAAHDDNLKETYDWNYWKSQRLHRIPLQVVPSYHLVVFWVMTPKSDFLLIGAETITSKGSMNTENVGKTSLFIE